ncbi:MAG: DinB family protein [Gemmatimonadota bacterium]
MTPVSEAAAHSTFVAGPRRIAEAVEGLTEEQLTARARGPATWSILEIVCHVADSEIMGAARFRQALTGSSRQFAYYDQDVWTSSLDSQGRGAGAIDDSLAVLGSLRRATASLLMRADPEAMRRTGVHPEHGEMTVVDLLEMYADHCERHRRQILEIRELLGVPLPAYA